MTPAVTRNGGQPAASPLTSSLVFVIPAYNPTHELIALVQNLSHHPPHHPIVVVDDGSSRESKTIFQAILTQPAVCLLEHATHSGKGQALKTAIQYITGHYPACAHVVTADADGQHAVHDILSVAHEAKTRSEELVLGSREFSDDVPIRSRIGNTIIRVLFRIRTGLTLRDTQTGLRGIPTRLGLHSLALPQIGYDFETAMLLECHSININIREIPIKTIYIEGNRYSHFNPLVDSFKICGVILRSALHAWKTFLTPMAEARPPRFPSPLTITHAPGVEKTSRFPPRTGSMNTVMTHDGSSENIASRYDESR